MKSTFFLLLVATTVAFTAVHGAEGGEQRHVTCGSAIKLRHLDSGNYLLKSSEHQYSHNGQQIVTLDTRGDPSSLLWQVREAHNTTSCVTGEPIRCGATVRLVHVGTRRLLHSHGVPAPLSPRNGEVSGFGEDGVGDAGDNWKVQCLHPKEDGNADRLLLDRRRRLWESTTLLRLLHVDTNRWLSSSTKVKFSQSNCPGCPILGELEVSGTSRSSDASTFRADDGAYLQIVDV